MSDSDAFKELNDGLSDLVDRAAADTEALEKITWMFVRACNLMTDASNKFVAIGDVLFDRFNPEHRMVPPTWRERLAWIFNPRLAWMLRQNQRFMKQRSAYCRDLYRSATCSLIEVFQVLGIPHDSLNPLFTEDRGSDYQFGIDMKSLSGAYKVCEKAIEAKANSFKGYEAKKYAIRFKIDEILAQRERGGSERDGTTDTASGVKAYERDAYLSFVAAIQANPSLANRGLKEVYDWIREHGVQVNGTDYDLPEFATWQKYRSVGERHAK